MDYYELVIRYDTKQFMLLSIATVMVHQNPFSHGIRLLNTPTITFSQLSNVTLLTDNMLSMKHSLVLQSMTNTQVAKIVRF